MIYVPDIRDYKPFYIQIGTDDAFDLIGSPYYVVVRVSDYPPYKVKAPYNNQWHDEHGDEEYIGSDGLYVEAFTLRLECAMFAFGSVSDDTTDALIGNIKTRMYAFREALRAAGFFKIYDSTKGYGFQDVRLESFPTPPSENYRVIGNSKTVVGRAVKLLFTLELKVNDPVTDMTYSDGDIVEAS